MKPVKLKRDEYRSRRESIGNGKLSGKDLGHQAEPYRTHR